MSTDVRVRSHLSVLRCALTGAATLAVILAICWVGALTAPNLSHLTISLFTVEPVTSPAALLVGLCWASAFGALSGAIVALTYNALGFVER